MSQKNATAVAQLTLALGTLTAFAITAAAPATALPRTEPRQPHPAHSTPLAATDHYLKQITETAAPADRVGAGADRLQDAPHALVAEPPLDPLAAGIDALSQPVSTLETIVAIRGKIPLAFKELLPPEVVGFYRGLTSEERNILKEVASSHQEFQTEEQALEALKERSQKLYGKAVELRQLLKTKLDALNPAAKTFIDSLVEEAKVLRPKGGERPNLQEIQQKAKEIIEKYKALSDEAKESLKTNFPKITGIIQDERFLALAPSIFFEG
ncbi:hypothetical protein [Streptomyces sp. CBMA152]|uniref:hypothetical protein n=1 Tax=Streptomyces sp. CBMA152 TaxID=1896312 RepID=UPI001660AFED|nr:hypothetical protein [Streptomyces sp. CBMA152]